MANLQATEKERSEFKEVEQVLRIFDKKVQEAVREAGIKNVNYLESGFEFRYNGKTIEVKLQIK